MKMSIKLLVVAITLGLLVSCNDTQPESTHPDQLIEKYEVKLLFEQDSVKVYQFFANGRYHYFTSRGSTSTVQTSEKSSYNEEIEF